jgi:uncharacterized protein (DUF362 family)
LGHGAKAALVGAAGLLPGCPEIPAPPYAPVERRARVVATLGDDLREMTRQALAASGGAEAIVAPGERVFIKPNFGAFGMVKYNAVAAGDSTKPEIALTVAEECLKAGAAEVIIGEGGQAYSWSWDDIYTLDGVSSVAAAAQCLSDAYEGKVTLACLQKDSPSWTTVPSCTKLGQLYVSSLLTEADKVISIPVIKSHRWTQITASLKNFVGVTSAMRYGYGVQWRFRLHDAGIEQCFLDIARAVQPDFAIVDCSIGCEGNGPHVLPGYWGTTVDMRDRLGQWLLLSSADLAAADATVARVISHDVAAITHLCMAYDQGLGQIQEDKIDLEGASIEDIRVEWQPAEHTEGFAEVLIPGIHLLQS